MPYAIRKSGKKYQTIKKSTGKVLGTHSSKKKARAQEIAIILNEKRRGKK